MPQDPRHVVILLCTYNGARFLPQQLASYLDQTHKNWSLWISDDGSTDTTPDILEQFRRDHEDTHDIRIMQGPGKGSASPNFMTLLCNPDLPAGLVALSDQDDIWLPEKLSRALELIPQASPVPVLYAAQSYHIDSQGIRYGQSRLPSAPFAFERAMLQNVLAGHTMVLDPDARDLVRRAGVPDAVEFHDWWLALLLGGAGARIIVDDHRVVLYRRHGTNVLGPAGSLSAVRHRIGKLVNRDYGQWVMANSMGLHAVSHLLLPCNAGIVSRFVTARSSAGFARVRLMRQLGLHRASRAQTLLLYVLFFQAVSRVRLP